MVILLPATLKVLPRNIAPLTPTPPVTTTVPVVVELLAVPAVNVVAALLVNVVNAPVDLVVAPIGVLFKLVAVVTPNVVVLLEPSVVNAPVDLVVAPMGVLFKLVAVVTPNVVVLLELSVVNAPVLGVILPIGVLLMLEVVNVPPTFKLPLIPTPPVTTNVPVVDVVDATPPATCSVLVPLSVPVRISTLPEYCAIFTNPVSKTSMLGIPDTSFTENIVPDKLLVIENNCPADPSKLSVPLLVGYARNVIF
jgi:hypothetical protein